MKTILAIVACSICAILIYSLGAKGQANARAMMRLQALNGKANGTIVWNGTSDVRTLVHNAAGDSLHTVTATEAGITHAGQLQIRVEVLKRNNVTVNELNLVATVVGPTNLPLTTYQAPCLECEDPDDENNCLDKDLRRPISNVAFITRLVSTPVTINGIGSKVFTLSCAEVTRLQRVIDTLGANRLKLGLSICQTVEGDVDTSGSPVLSVVSLGSSGAPLPNVASFNPPARTAGSAGFTLSLNGSGFGAGARMLWGGSERVSASVNSSTLTAAISAADVATPRTVKVSVVNPDCGRAVERDFVINPVPTITTSSLPAGTVGSPYSQPLAVSGGTQPFTWARAGGALPDGLTLNQGVISGTPTRIGIFTFTVQLTDSSSVGTTKPFTIEIRYPPVTGVPATNFRTDGVAMESIVAAFGQNLATRSERANTVPLPTTLAGATVRISNGVGTGILAPLFFVSPGQVNFQVPPDIVVAGNVTMTVTSGAGVISQGPMLVSRVAPGLFSADATGRGLAAAVALRVKADNTQIYEDVIRFDQSLGRFVAIPIDLGPTTDRVFLVLFGSGFRFRSSLSSVTVTVGGVNSEVFFAGKHDSLTGVDQINALLPRTLIGRGEVDVVLIVGGIEANRVRVAIK